MRCGVILSEAKDLLRIEQTFFTAKCTKSAKK